MAQEMTTTGDEASSIQTEDIIHFPDDINLLQPDQEHNDTSMPLEDHVGATMPSDFSESGSNEGADPDPLGVAQLSMAFNYTVYKIQDSLQTLITQTEEYIEHQSAMVSKDFHEIDSKILELKATVKKCGELKLKFDTIEQIGIFVQDFKNRVNSLELKLVELKSKKRKGNGKSSSSLLTS